MKHFYHSLRLVSMALLSALAQTSAFAQGTGAGSALNFDGAAGFVRAPDGVWFNGNFTVEGWVFVRSYNNWSRLIDFGNGEYRHNVYLALSEGGGGYPKMGVFNVGNAPLVGSAQQLPLNQWAHLAATFNAGTGSIYINGNLVGNGPIPVTPPNIVRTNNYLGRSNWGGDGYANAIFDEVRIWNTVRTRAQIVATMRNRLQGNEANLVGYWRFDEGSGIVANGIGGTIYLVNGGVGWINSTAPVAALSVAAHWRMGEDDAGASPGATSTLAMDSAGSQHLTVSGQASYSTDQPDGTPPERGSSISINFAAPSAYGVRSLVSAAQDNFGVETWVKPASTTGGQVIAYNGHTGTSGWGILLANGNYSALFGGRVVFGSAPAYSNIWTHVALVRNNGVATLYANGVAAGTSSETPNLPSGNFAVASTPQNPPGQFFVGRMDEVRVFTFAPGQFNPDDLLVDRSFVRPVMTLEPTVVAADTITLNGRVVNSDGLAGTAWFEWGPLTPFGRKTPNIPLPTGNGVVSVHHLLTNLATGLTYHYRLVASNALGVVRDRDVRFWAPTLTIQGNNPLFVKSQVVDPGATVTGLPSAIAGGTFFTLALKADGTMRGWGNNSSGQLNIPAVATNVVAIAAGSSHSLALRGDGTILAWGDPSANTIPAGAGKVVAIAANGFSLALKADGKILGWGANNVGQINIPPSATNVIAIAAGGLHGLALKSDGTVVGWGYNSRGQINIPPSATNVVAISAGTFHCLALRADGTVVGWGDNAYGQIGIPPHATNLIAIAAGDQHSLALRADGIVVAWGLNNQGRLNIAVGVTNVIAIEAGHWHSLALTAAGALLGAGYNAYGEVNIPAGLSDLNLPVASTSNVNTNVPGSYQWTYSATNAFGIAATASRTVVVFGPPIVANPFATLIATNPINGLRTVRFGASVNPNGAPAIISIPYGLTASYGEMSATSILPWGFTFQTAVFDAPLSPGFTYHWRILVTNGVDMFPGNASSSDLTFHIPSPNLAGDANGDSTIDPSELNTVRAEYRLTSPWLALTNLAVPGQSNVTFMLSDSRTGAYGVEASTNLAVWQFLAPAVPSFEFTDTNSPALSQRYYRLR